MKLPRKLTAAEIGGLSEGAHKDQSGVTLRVLPSGTRSWVLAYKSPPSTKKTRRISFGIWPQITLADARKLVAEAKVQLAKGGIDPQEAKDSAREALSVASALDTCKSVLRERPRRCLRLEKAQLRNICLEAQRRGSGSSRATKGAWMPVKAKRTCLHCQKKFPSAHSGNRICNLCAERKIGRYHAGTV